MDALRLPDNLARLRKEKKITQEELADFIGVTKASVSKWENGQSMPDILLLPQLATYFGVTLDALFGYEPQLSKEQIQTDLSRFHRRLRPAPLRRGAFGGPRRGAPVLRLLSAAFAAVRAVPEPFLHGQGRGGNAALLREMGALCEHILRKLQVRQTSAATRPRSRP